jgi:hypothetical protein
MAVDVKVEVLIRRTRAEVARYMFDPRHDAVWTTGVVECHPQQPGLLRTGAKVQRVSKFLGRRLPYLIEVVDHADEHFVEMVATEPFEMHVRYELEDADGGTLARICTRGGGTGFFRVAAPFLGRMVRRSITSDLETLREVLESHGDDVLPAAD